MNEQVEINRSGVREFFEVVLEIAKEMCSPRDASNEARLWFASKDVVKDNHRDWWVGP
jgi:hypothetical protein